ncbi:MAG: hypothetical protein WAN47_10015 [Nitrosotalea sp.]
MRFKPSLDGKGMATIPKDIYDQEMREFFKYCPHLCPLDESE